ncbi:hypothetical protein SAMN05216521_102033 [Enterocloster clostridioformis]|uniref:Uncharacterized protein n=1 Tax=Enterocloster clostridioformis TaxID=1531 RepID=A0A1I0GJT8_9FIRM|nr:hypothetical protein SAMN05216521_102033 [Enterocloster clostridioformis]SEW17170.1 hypothetical protein SAMN05216528_1012108 [Enterocloster clostridioformis]
MSYFYSMFHIFTRRHPFKITNRVIFRITIDMIYLSFF